MVKSWAYMGGEAGPAYIAGTAAGNIITSFDGGVTWVTTETILGGPNINSPGMTKAGGAYYIGSPTGSNPYYKSAAGQGMGGFVLDSAGGIAAHSLISGAGLFVTGRNAATPTYHTSNDLITFTLRSAAGFNGASGMHPTAISFQNNYFCAINQLATPQVGRSLDGINWVDIQAIGLGPSGIIGGLFVSYQNGVYYASISNDGVYRSADFLSWGRVLVSPAIVGYHAIASNGDTIVTVGDSRNIAYSLNNGGTWTQILVGATSENWLDVKWVPSWGRFVAITSLSSAGSITTSPDGVTWTIPVSPIASYRSAMLR